MFRKSSQVSALNDGKTPCPHEYCKRIVGTDVPDGPQSEAQTCGKTLCPDKFRGNLCLLQREKAISDTYKD